MKYFRYYTITAFISAATMLGLSGCLSANQQTSHLSESLTLDYMTGPKIKIGDDITVWIENQTEYCIKFPYDYETEVFVESDTGILTVANLVSYTDDKSIELQPKGNPFDSRHLVFIYPDVSELSLQKPTNFYATITGTLCDDNSVIIEKTIPFTLMP